MVAPYLLGLYVLFQNFKTPEGKFIFPLLAITSVPASLTSHPFSTQRALPLLLPMMIVIGLGIDKFIIILRQKYLPFFTALLLFVSLFFLWRSYFILLPHEWAKIWDYGYKELLVFMCYPAQKFHQKVGGSVRNNYYHLTKFSPDYNFSNIETRSII